MVQQLRAQQALSRSVNVTPGPKVLRHPLLQSLEGTLQVFTSVHRSFFTNVMVQALRSADQGAAVLIVQFLKGGICQGPEHMTQMGQNLDWVRCGYAGCITEATPDAEPAMAELWAYVQQAVQEARYSIVVLDELSLAVDYGLISESEVLTFLEQRPPQMDMILTGPKMPYSILAIADQVTEFRRDFLP